MKLGNEIVWDKPDEGGAGGGSDTPTTTPETPAAPESTDSPAAPPPTQAETGSSGGETPASPTPSQEAPQWAVDRIAQLTARLSEEREKNKKSGVTAAAPAPSDTRPDPNSEFEQRVAAAAEAKARLDAFNAACVATRKAGDSTFGGAEFAAKLNNLTSNLVDVNDPASIQRYNGFLEAAIDLADGDPKVTAGIIYSLGSNLNEASRVLSLSPVKLGAELAKMVSKSAASEAPDPLSSAPKPISPISPKGAQHSQIDPSDPTRADNIPIDVWMQRREEQVKRAGR